MTGHACSHRPPFKAPQHVCVCRTPPRPGHCSLPVAHRSLRGLGVQGAQEPAGTLQTHSTSVCAGVFPHLQLHPPPCNPLHGHLHSCTWVRPCFLHCAYCGLSVQGLSTACSRKAPSSSPLMRGRPGGLWHNCQPLGEQMQHRMGGAAAAITTCSVSYHHGRSAASPLRLNVMLHATCDSQHPSSCLQALLVWWH